jgi:hypothetical protein
MREDRTVLLFVLAISTACLSIMSGLLSVHTYCENRLIVGIFAFGATVIIILFIRNQGRTSFRRILSLLGATICLLTTGVNIWFIWYATQLCHHMFDQVRP